MSGLRDVFIVDGARTPLLKSKNKPGPFSASDLAVAAGRAVLSRQPINPAELGEVIVGCVMPAVDEANIGRVVSLRLGCGKKVPAYTVGRNCASGLQALDCAMKDISMGRHDLVLAGGTEAMSRYPLLVTPQMQSWITDWMVAKTFGQKLSLLPAFRPKYLRPIIGVLEGLTDHVSGISMGQTAEVLAHRFNISRVEMDAFSIESHRRLEFAAENGRLEELIPIFGADGTVYDVDDGLRRDSTAEKLAKLKPVFDRKLGKVTAGNSAQITDGSAMLLLASESAVKSRGLPVLGRMVDVKWAGVEPTEMGLGPVPAIAELLKGNNMKGADYWEINEAFACQVMACLKAYADPEYLLKEVGIDSSLDPIDTARLNVDGGAVSMGHPVGTSGARITLHLLNVLRRNNARFGVASMCIGGGQGGAVLLERVS
ncbi:MAG: acetyl-CoA C-acetyltransferase [Nitrospinae bacterium]|nr:acetyl-CoA C-acetyltransferase [Nitrospinota bacterium]